MDNLVKSVKIGSIEFEFDYTLHQLYISTSGHDTRFAGYLDSEEWDEFISEATGGGCQKDIERPEDEIADASREG